MTENPAVRNFSDSMIMHPGIPTGLGINDPSGINRDQNGADRARESDLIQKHPRPSDACG